ncbi:hypothetical protein PENTCL1PPCAC_27258, partial [Pristionchus entomophagus]
FVFVLLLLIVLGHSLLLLLLHQFLILHRVSPPFSGTFPPRLATPNCLLLFLPLFVLLIALSLAERILIILCLPCSLLRLLISFLSQLHQLLFRSLLELASILIATQAIIEEGKRVVLLFHLELETRTIVNSQLFS